MKNTHSAHEIIMLNDDEIAQVAGGVTPLEYMLALRFVSMRIGSAQISTSMTMSQDAVTNLVTNETTVSLNAQDIGAVGALV